MLGLIEIYLRVVRNAMPRAAAVRVCGVTAAGGSRGCLSRPHVQALGAARAESVHHQEDQVTMRNLLNAEWPGNMKIMRATLTLLLYRMVVALFKVIGGSSYFSCFRY